MNSQKIALITGGSRGIGKSLVDYFVKRHWRVATCATKKENLIHSKADLTFVCDIGNVEQVKAGIKIVAEKYKQIDVLINNAGTSGSNPLEPDSSSDQMWHKIIDTNLHGCYYMCKYGLPLLKNGQGKIINISSVLGLIGVSDQSAYTASKHGIVGLTKSLALYLAPRGITVNAICPGWVETDMAKRRFKALSLTKSEIEKMIPLGNILKPSEVASLAFYLASLEASNITGQTFTIDGGQTL